MKLQFLKFEKIGENYLHEKNGLLKEYAVKKNVNFFPNKILIFFF